jgi:hypothetical protein
MFGKNLDLIFYPLVWAQPGMLAFYKLLFGA